jgi:hypothetical protein
MDRCPASLCERLRLISHVYPTQKGSGEVSFYPHGPVLYGPAKHPKKDYNGPFLNLEHFPCQSRPSHGFITPCPGPTVSLRMRSWRVFIISFCSTVKHPLQRADVAQPLKTFQRDSQSNFAVMSFSHPEAQGPFGFRSPPMSPIRQRSNRGNGSVRTEEIPPLFPMEPGFACAPCLFHIKLNSTAISDAE